MRALSTLIATSQTRVKAVILKYQLLSMFDQLNEMWLYFLWYTVKFRNKAPGLIFFKGLFSGLIFRGAYFRREISVSQSAGLIIGGKFVLAIFQCANDNIGALTRNL